MTDPAAYLKGLADRLSADGCSVTHEQFGDRTVLVGYQSQMNGPAVRTTRSPLSERGKETL